MSAEKPPQIADVLDRFEAASIVGVKNMDAKGFREWTALRAELGACIERQREAIRRAEKKELEALADLDEATAKSNAQREAVKLATSRLRLVYAHYSATEIANASPSSQLGNWRDGLAHLEEALR